MQSITLSSFSTCLLIDIGTDWAVYAQFMAKNMIFTVNMDVLSVKLMGE
jgi:hypothetical protein